MSTSLSTKHTALSCCTSILSCFPNNLSCFPKDLSCFPNDLSCFPNNLSGFPNSLSGFPNNLCYFHDKLSSFPSNLHLRWWLNLSITLHWLTDTRSKFQSATGVWSVRPLHFLAMRLGDMNTSLPHHTHFPHMSGRCEHILSSPHCFFTISLTYLECVNTSFPRHTISLTYLEDVNTSLPHHTSFPHLTPFPHHTSLPHYFKRRQMY